MGTCLHVYHVKRNNLFSQLNNVSSYIYLRNKNRSKGPVLIGLEEIVQRQVGVGWVGRGWGG